MEHLERLSYGCALRLGISKENPTGHRAESVLLARSDQLDPVTAIDIWRARAGTEAEPLLAVVGSHPQVPISKDSLPDRLRRLAVDARVTTRPTGHSLRRSWATHADERGVDPVTLSRHLRHRDLSTTLSYVAKLSAWVDNAARELIDHNTHPRQQRRRVRHGCGPVSQRRPDTGSVDVGDGVVLCAGLNRFGKPCTN